VAHVQLKAAQFHAETCYRAALDLHEKENIPEEIARLKAGSALIAEARKHSKGAVVGPLQDVLHDVLRHEAGDEHQPQPGAGEQGDQ
jgi:programmed cell death 6-interacting protein